MAGPHQVERISVRPQSMISPIKRSNMKKASEPNAPLNL
jgi:hypothetical protein